MPFPLTRYSPRIIPAVPRAAPCGTIAAMAQRIQARNRELEASRRRGGDVLASECKLKERSNRNPLAYPIA